MWLQYSTSEHVQGDITIDATPSLRSTALPIGTAGSVQTVAAVQIFRAEPHATSLVASRSIPKALAELFDITLLTYEP